MIFDNIANIEKYKGLYNNLDTTIDFIKSNKLQLLTLGKNIIKGEDIYANYNINTETINEIDGIYEMHYNYLDLHIDIEGSEKILFTDYKQEKETGSYSQQEDYVLLNGKATAQCVLDKTHFAICMTQEPHMPCVRQGNANTISKVIFKIKTS